MKSKLLKMFKGCMRGRTLYVVRSPWPAGFAHLQSGRATHRFSLCPTSIGHDSHGESVLGSLGEIAPSCHACTRLENRESWEADVPCRVKPIPEKKYIVHFRTIHRSGRTDPVRGNALLGKNWR